MNEAKENGKKMSLENVAYEELKNAIVVGIYPPGIQIVEEQIANQLNISRSPVRIAIKRLEAEGFLDRYSNKRIYVAFADAKRTVDALYIREALEGMAARLAAINRTQEHIVQLQNLFSVMEQAQAGHDEIDAKCSLKVGDNITTDHIMPAGAKILPLRSNIPKISEYCFAVCDEEFPKRALDLKRSIIIGGSNYGQGSSREHAALAPLYLGVKAVLTKSFARIHMANLINAGILPMTFANEADYDKVDQMDDLYIANVREQVKNSDIIKITDKTKGFEFEAKLDLSERQRAMLLAGGLLNYTKENA